MSSRAGLVDCCSVFGLVRVTDYLWFGAMPSRQRFFVELKEEETTVVSWKKLVADAEGTMEFGMPSEAPAGANPALEARIAPEVKHDPRGFCVW